MDSRQVEDEEQRARLDALEERVRELERREAALEASERMLRLVMETIPQRLFWKDRDSRFLGCNRAFARDARLDNPEDVVGKDDFAMVWRETAPRYRADDRAVIEHEFSRINYEEPMRIGDDMRWLRTSKVPLRDESGRVIGVFGCYDDITDSHAATRAQEESEARYRSIFEYASDAILIVDTDGRFCAANPAACALLGYSSDELVDLRVHDVVVAEEHAPSFEPVSEQRDRVLREQTIVRKDGSRAVVEVHARALPDGRSMAIVRDLTERRRLETERRHAQKLETLGRLAGGVAHDFNNVLTAVLNCAELARRRSENGEDPSGELYLIGQACERAMALTRQLLDFARREPLRSEPLQVVDVLQGAGALLASLAGEGIRIDLEAPRGLPLIRGDAGELEQVLLNLVANARDAMPEGGELRVRARAEPEGADPQWVLLEVADTGRGMDARTLEQAFEPFFTTKAAGEGTGLGLSAVDRIVTRAGGHIRVESQPGQGTAIELRFPAAPAV